MLTETRPQVPNVVHYGPGEVNPPWLHLSWTEQKATPEDETGDDENMNPHRILSVGQCAFDHGSLTRYLHKILDAEVEAADTSAEALDRLKTEPFDLVLVNRIGDRDGQPGIHLIRALKNEGSLSETRVMLVSDHQSAQEEAIQAGALKGFGKSDLNTNRAAQALKAALVAPV